MQQKIFTIPVIGGEVLNEEMNVFLRSKKNIQVERHIIQQNQGNFWTFCISYLDDITGVGDKIKIDYRQALDEKTFAIFARLREIRKKIATDEGVPAYAIFTDEELSNIAKLDEFTSSKMLKVKGIGEKKVEKYAQRFISEMEEKK
jgi:superfamily II DNA helicase RecQ